MASGSGDGSRLFSWQTGVATGLTVVGAILALGLVRYATVAPTSLPQAFYYRWNPRLMELHAVSDTLIWLAYIAIALTLVRLVKGTHGTIPFSGMVLAFGVFIVAGGFTHFFDVLTLWRPYYWLASWVNAIAALASIITAIALPPLVPRIKAMMTLTRQARQQEEQRELLLRASEQHYRQMFDTNIAGVFRCDEEGHIIECNDAFAHLFGHASAAEALGAGDERFHLDRAYINSVQKRGELSEREVCWRRHDGTEMWLSARASLLMAADGSSVVQGSIVNISGQKGLERQLLQAQKMEAIGRLASGVAHDFNNVLTVIAGQSDLLAREMPDGPAHRRIQAVKDAAERGAVLTRHLLSISRHQPMRTQAVDLNATVRRMEDTLAWLVGENNIVMQLLLSQDLALIEAVPAEIEQVISNLVVNARDAMPNGGQLLIQSMNIETAHPVRDRFSEVAPGRYVLLRVKDTGTGIPIEVMAHIFEPFFTTKEVDKGTGLGLATVFGVVQHSGGQILVDSTVGRGTVFRIYFQPAETTQQRELADSFATRQLQAGAIRRILLVEQEDHVREFLADALRNAGFDVVSAYSSEAALGLCTETQAPLDVLVTTVSLPKMSGTELARRLIERYPDLRVLFISSHSPCEVDVDVMQRPGVACLEKPFTPSDLTRHVAALLDGTERGPVT